jgi:septal ring factor EnvC (AmiA/AmiB activator)
MTQRVTISFAVPTALHVVIGIVLAAAVVAAFLVHFELPMDSAYRGATVAAGVIAACGVLAYWQWCALQRARVDAGEATKILLEAIEEIRTENANRDRELLAALNSIRDGLAALAEEITDNRGAIKKLNDAVDEAIGAIEALQNSYIRRGHKHATPETRPKDREDYA